MATKSKYQVKLHSFSRLGRCTPIARSSTTGLGGYRALEIDWSQISDRLVYRIYEKPAPRRVLILSFAEHDAAYERATQRKKI